MGKPELKGKVWLREGRVEFCRSRKGRNDEKGKKRANLSSEVRLGKGEGMGR